jgi:hypothetical protein
MKSFFYIILLTFILWPLNAKGLERWGVEPQTDYYKNKVGSFIEKITLKDIEGKDVSLYNDESKFTVLTIFDTRCPISKKILPKIQRLEKSYPEIEFRHIVLSKLFSNEELQRVYKEKGLRGKLLLDSKNVFKNNIKIKTTCESFIIDKQGTLVYRGAIDDQYGINIIKKEPTRSFLSDALDQLLKNERVNFPLTGAPGCLVALDDVPLKDTSITFHKDISRILQNKCQECHRDGGVGPFNLMTLDEVKEQRKMIRYVLKKNLMPPWFAENDREWLHDFSLAEEEKKTLLTWLESGTPAGKIIHSPLPKKWPKEGLMDKPDLVVKFPKIKVQAEGFMDYVYKTIVVPIKEDKWVKAVETRTLNPQVLHHALVFTTDNPKQKRVNALAGFFAGYVPGTALNDFPEGTGKFLPKGTYLIAQLHYTPNGTEVEDQISLYFDFHDKEPEREIVTKSAFSRHIEIPPKTDNHKIVAMHRFKEDGFIAGLNPHAHLRGKSFKYELINSEGEREVLVDIPNYDFNWQINYQPLKPIFTPKGSTLEVTAYYDNSSKNKNNPNPNVIVRFGEQTNDEMMIGYFEWFSSTLIKDRPKTIGFADLPEDLKKYVTEVKKQMKVGKLKPKKAKKAIINFIQQKVKKGEYAKKDVSIYSQSILKYFRR